MSFSGRPLVVDEIEQVAASYAYLAPDGRTLLYDDRLGGACVRGVEGGRRHRIDAADHDLEIDTAAWSPDGRRIALTDSHLATDSPGVWVLDVVSGELTGRTAGAVDGYPSWSADGEWIRFIRKGFAGAIEVLAVPAAGGEPTRLRSLDTAWAELATVAWAADSIAWSAIPAGGGAGAVFVADWSGAQRTLLTGRYWHLSFPAAGDLLLADEAGEDGSTPAAGAARVVPVEGGSPMPVAAGQVTRPGWGPEGHAIVYIDGTGPVRVVPEPGAEPWTLYDRRQVGAANVSSLRWVRDALLVMVDELLPVVLRLE